MARLGILGTGPAGMIAALALHQAGHDITLAGPALKAGDKRTTALMAPSLRMLDALGVWQGLKPLSAPLRKMRIIDGTKRLLRAPTVTFHASEIDEEAFGYNIPNDALNAALDAALNAAGIARHDGVATEITSATAGIHVLLADGTRLAFDGLIGADGKDSPCRKAAGITTRETGLPQSALVCMFTHSQPHGDFSNEIHTETGPCTTVPLPGVNRSSLVWVLKPEDADAMAALPAADLSRRIEARLGSMLGAVAVDETLGAQVWRLTGVLASKASAGRIALVGEAAHRFPPIGAQGLNLTMRDVRDLVEALAANDAAPTAFADFASRRAADTRMRYATVMTLNRSLLTSLLPAQLLRGVGLSLLDLAAPLRGFMMREGLEPGSGWRHIASRSERQQA